MKFSTAAVAALGLATAASASPVVVKRQQGGSSGAPVSSRASAVITPSASAVSAASSAVASATGRASSAAAPSATSSAGSSGSAGGSNSTSGSGSGSGSGSQRLNDTQILQYALTLEHLEAAFYNQSLQKLGEDAFTQAGYNASTRNQIYSIGRDEAAHVDFLTQALGDDAVGQCSYNFSAVTDVPSFLATAQVLEGVGVSAYLGAAKNISGKDYLEAAGAILTVESRHASYLNSQVNKDGNVIPAPFDTPLGFNQVYSLAAPFITECPPNQSLPLSPFPKATLAPAGASAQDAGNGTFAPGDSVTVTYDNSTSGNNGTASAQGGNSQETYLAIIQGPTPPVFLPLQGDQPVTLPANLTGGQIYAVVTSSNDAVTDDNTLAGPAVAFINVPLPEAPPASSSAAAASTTAGGASSASAGSSSTGAAAVPGATQSSSGTASSVGSAAASTATGSSGGGDAQASAQSAALSSASAFTGSLGSAPLAQPTSA